MGHKGWDWRSKKFWTDGWGSLFLAVFIALFIRWGFLEAYVIPSGSMLPSLLIHDHIFVNKLKEMQKTLETSTTDATKMKTILDKFQPSMKKLKDGAKDVSGGVSSLDEGLEELNKQTAPGIVALNNGIDKLTSNNATLNGGASALSDATGTLAGQSGTFNEMADGLDTLGGAFETLNDGAKQLYEGNEQFKSEGLDQLKEKVDLGVGELETLQSVMDEIKAMNKEYASYSGAPEGATVTSRYVFRTKEESSK